MIARVLGKLLHMVGILPTDKVTEVQRTDLVGEFVGHTGPKTRRKVNFVILKVYLFNITYSRGFFDQVNGCICRFKKLRGGFYLLMRPID